MAVNLCEETRTLQWTVCVDAYRLASFIPYPYTGKGLYPSLLTSNTQNIQTHKMKEATVRGSPLSSRVPEVLPGGGGDGGLGRSGGEGG